MAEDYDVLFHALSPPGQLADLPRFPHVQVAVGNPEFKAFDFQKAVRLGFYRAAHHIAVAGYCVYGLVYHVVERIGIHGVIAAMDPAFHRWRCGQNLPYSRHAAMSIAYNSYFHNV